MKLFHPLLNKSPWLTILLAAMAITAAINPRVKIQNGEVLAIGCNAKHIFVTKNYFTGYEVPTGIYSVDQVTTLIYEITLRELRAELAGNPFAYFGESIIEAHKENIFSAMDEQLLSNCQL